MTLYFFHFWFTISATVKEYLYISAYNEAATTGECVDTYTNRTKNPFLKGNCNEAGYAMLCIARNSNKLNNPETTDDNKEFTARAAPISNAAPSCSLNLTTVKQLGAKSVSEAVDFVIQTGTTSGAIGLSGR